MARRQAYPTFLDRLRVSIGPGMNEHEDKVARFTAVSFGLLAFVMLGLTVLDHL